MLKAPEQKRCSMIQGSSQARAARSATGQGTRGRSTRSSLIVFPGSCCRSRNLLGETPSLASSSEAAGIICARRAGGWRETSRTRRRPECCRTHGAVTPDLIRRPSQGLLRLCVMLLDPQAQSIQPEHFRQAGWRKERLDSRRLRGRGQIGDQVPGGEIWQCVRISGHSHGSFCLLWPRGSGHNLQRPPVPGATIAQGSGDHNPRAGMLNILPASCVRGFERHYRGLCQRTQPARASLDAPIARPPARRSGVWRERRGPSSPGQHRVPGWMIRPPGEKRPARRPTGW